MTFWSIALAHCFVGSLVGLRAGVIGAWLRASSRDKGYKDIGYDRHSRQRLYTHGREPDRELLRPDQDDYLTWLFWGVVAGLCAWPVVLTFGGFKRFFLAPPKEMKTAMELVEQKRENDRLDSELDDALLEAKRALELARLNALLAQPSPSPYGA